MCFLIFRIPYSVYYLAISLTIGLIFCFLSQFFLKVSSKTILSSVGGSFSSSGGGGKQMVLLIDVVQGPLPECGRTL